jgi:hypothetical protein
LDFNQDKICESIVLANGTMVENPSLQTTQLEKTISEPIPKPLEGKCLGLANSPTFCANILMSDGTVVKNPDCTTIKIGEGYKTECPHTKPQVQAQTVEEDEEASGGGSSSGGSSDGSSDLPYCDEVNFNQECFDRRDFDAETGLYPCKDGSYEEDWRDCNGDSSGNDDDDNDSSDLDDDSDDDGDNCQSQDDFCDDDEGCESDSVDCIDDRGFDEDDYDG